MGGGLYSRILAPSSWRRIFIPYLNSADGLYCWLISLLEAGGETVRIAGKIMADSTSERGQYIVVARRYRPQGFDDLVGQGMVSQALKNAITTDRVGHAYLFTGARGVGKTSTARILSKALNCEKGPTETPCHECDICQTIAAGEDVDVLEIDGASNRGIDEIRQLRSNVNVRPSRSRYKIYIIDEVHMLTKEAFNALLKTLEEPPEHVKFIFCTTDPEKIPITVLSRCQRFDFSPVGADEIVARLRHIVDTEGAEADDEALRLLARKAAGSVRDSQSLLEQLLSFTSDRITPEAVHSMLGTAGTARLYGVVGCLAKHDSAGALRELDLAFGDGVDAGQLTEQLLGCLRDLMAISVGGDKELLLHASEADFDQLSEIAQSWGTTNLLAAAQIVDQALARMRVVTHARILLETALIRISQLEDLQDLSELIAQVQSGEIPAAGKKKTAKSVTQPKADPAVSTARPSMPVTNEAAGQAASNPPTSPATTVDSPNLTSNSDLATGAADEPTASATTDTPKSPAEVSSGEELWREAISRLDGMAADCAANFVEAKFAGANSGPKRLVVTFPDSYNSSKSFCESPERLIEIENTLAGIAGKKVKLEFSLRASPAEKRPAKPSISLRQREREISQRDFVKHAVDLFSGDITNISVPRSE